MNIQPDDIIEAVLSAIPEPFFVFDENGYYVQILGGVDREKYHDGHHLIGKRIHDVMRTELADRFVEQIQGVIRSGRVQTYEYQLSAEDIQGSGGLPGPQEKQWFEAHISPVKAVEGRPPMVVWIAFNITGMKGILPICSLCKKIRDDAGYWNQLEAYIRDHSRADLPHSICPDCAKILYPELDTYAK